MLQNFISSPWQNPQKQSYSLTPTDSTFLGPSRNHLFQTPSRSRMACQNPSQSMGDNKNSCNHSLDRQNYFSSSNLNGQAVNEKCSDRFIPKIKMSSNYYSLLLTEQKQKSQRRDKSQRMTQSPQQDSQNNNESQGEDESNTRRHNSQQRQRKNSSSEDTYTELLRNNIIKEINDYSNRQHITGISLFSDSKKHSSSTSFNNKINGGGGEEGDIGQQKKAPKVLSYKMNIHRKSQMIQEADDIVFTNEPQENRKISSKPYKILDAPSLSGDFYTNILEWTRQNLVVVALNNQVYTWSPVRHDVTNLMENSQSADDVPQANIVSLSSNRDGEILAVGDEAGLVKIFDIEKSKVIYEYQGHTDRIGAIAWNSHLLTTASKDYSIKIRDIRTKANISVLNFHKEQVCGIKWSEDGMNLASGGNDNKVCVYNMKMNKLTSVFQSHNGAVKALAWSPHKQNVLVSGGGNKDQTLKFWNTQTNSLIKSIHTGSQVCNMVFSKNHNEIVTTHGFQLNQVSVWSADNYSQIVTLYGHTERVLYLALSPDQEDIVTGSADETLRFWKVFNQNKKREQSHGQSKLDPIFSSIR